MSANEPIVTVVIAEVDTGRFYFRAVDTTADGARRALHRAWVAHCTEYAPTGAHLYTWGEVSQMIDLHTVAVGTATRDGEPIGGNEWPPPAATCPCGATDHVLATHPTAQVQAFHPVFGHYVMDDPIAEHRDGEHDAHPDPDSCAACAALGDG